MPVTQITIGRFHHFHLARQLERFGLLREIWTGYPRGRLRDEQGIPPEKIRTFPLLQAAYMLALRSPSLARWREGIDALAWWAKETLDRRAAMSIKEPGVLVALSGNGLYSGRKMKVLGGTYICDRGSSHIRYQEEILAEEYGRWGLKWRGIDPRVVGREEAEYELADVITVPSGFCERSFVEKGVPAAKMRRIPYGGRIERFSPVGEPPQDEFNVLFVGQVSLRKGIPYLLEAFARFKHPRKRLRIVGNLDQDLRKVLPRLPHEGVEFLGQIPNRLLPGLYSRSDCFVLPSIEEGLAMVMGEAMACGCPVIASKNTGAEDLFESGSGGFITEIRDVEAMTSSMTAIADGGAEALRGAARSRILSQGGWDRYGADWQKLLSQVLQ